MARSPFSKLSVRQPVPAVGDVVQTVSGAPVGEVAETGEKSFLVRGTNIEMWMREQSVFTRTGHFLTLICEREGLPAYSDGEHEQPGE
jgi:hypothetical protein